MMDLAKVALDTATARGAQYADARACTYRSQNLSAEEARVSGISDDESRGIGVRVLVNGAWGFAAGAVERAEGAMSLAAEAVEVAKASARLMPKPVELVPEPPRRERFASECTVDPFTVGVDRKVGLLLEINDRLLRQKGVSKANAHMTLRRCVRAFLNSEGAELASDVVTTNAGYMATAVGEHDARSRSYNPPGRTLGFENVDADDLLANTERVAQQAVEHLHAPDCEPGVYNLVLDPLNLALTMHESVGHATELDRALGFEESLAGRSFATPDKLNRLQYGSEVVNFVADNTLPGGLATHGFDDDGVAGQRWNIVKDGVFSGYSTSREVAGEIGLARSTGGCRADHWSSIPIVRIPNLSLMPGTSPLALDELLADTGDGIYIEGHGSFSIDQMRCNFQFGGDAFWRIRDGRLAGMLKNVTYQSLTTDFWGACDAICDQRFWVPNGVLNCGKGDPMQISQMTHGAAPARFRGVEVGGAFRR